MRLFSMFPAIAGAKIRAQHTRERAKEVIREADGAEAEAWSIRKEGYGGPAQSSPTITERGRSLRAVSSEFRPPIQAVSLADIA
jgi:hypothetical protein